MEIRIAVIDDMKADYENLCKELLAWQASAHHKLIIKHYDSPMKVMFDYESNEFNFDLLFLDVVMPNMNGIDLIRELQKTNPHILFIMTSSDNVYAADGYNIYAFDFLPKPVDPYRLSRAMNRAVTKIDALKTETFIVSAEEQTLKLAYSDVVYFEGKGNYTFIHTTDGNEIKARATLKSYFKNCPDSFVKINRNCIVNMVYVAGYNPEQVMIRNLNICLPLSKAAYAEVAELFKILR